jgi:hypothetical protein
MSLWKEGGSGPEKFGDHWFRGFLEEKSPFCFLDHLKVSYLWCYNVHIQVTPTCDEQNLGFRGVGWD